MAVRQVCQVRATSAFLRIPGSVARAREPGRSPTCARPTRFHAAATPGYDHHQLGFWGRRCIGAAGVSCAPPPVARANRATPKRCRLFACMPPVPGKYNDIPPRPNRSRMCHTHARTGPAPGVCCAQAGGADAVEGGQPHVLAGPPVSVATVGGGSWQLAVDCPRKWRLPEAWLLVVGMEGLRTGGGPRHWAGGILVKRRLGSHTSHRHEHPYSTTARVLRIRIAPHT